MINCWFGLVVWDFYDTLMKGLESQTTNPNHQLTISWKSARQKTNFILQEYIRLYMHLRHESYFCMYIPIYSNCSTIRTIQTFTKHQILGSGILWGAVHDTLTSCLFVLHSAFLDDTHNFRSQICCWWFRNPKQPPGIYRPPVNNGIFTTKLNSFSGRISEPSTTYQRQLASLSQTFWTFTWPFSTVSPLGSADPWWFPWSFPGWEMGSQCFPKTFGSFSCWTSKLRWGTLN